MPGQDPKPPIADEIENDPAIAEDIGAAADQDVAIELPVEDGDADGQPV